ncbi:MAG: phosphoribosylanthranilate isomerase [Eubacteriales bacterium]|nr:phosphoribosylanthranilate isomerase [Eubacteriales bacterium]
MTKIKLCGLSRPCDIEAANALRPEYIGFVFAQKSKRYVEVNVAAQLKRMLLPDIRAVGVFVDAPCEEVADLLRQNIIDVAQLHGHEDEAYIRKLRTLAGRPIIKAFRVQSQQDMEAANACSADYVLLDSGAGTGTTFDWNIIKNMRRLYFLAGGLEIGNVKTAVNTLHPFAVDVSSGIETDGVKDKTKMAAFVAAVRKEERL